jgi:translocation and assembly module TamA
VRRKPVRARFRRHVVILALFFVGLSPIDAARAFDQISFQTPGAPKDLRKFILAASLLEQARGDKTSDAQSVFAAARADYGRILGALYADGYYSGVISILIDGREASAIDPLDAPSAIGAVAINVASGPRFTFLRARMRPYAHGTDIPPGYGDTAPARSTAIVAAADSGVAGWRRAGHAKALVADQTVIADHAAATIDALILLDPGPRLRFGPLTITGNERMRMRRMVEIAGYPTGEVFDPDKLDAVLTRLRRTGVFRSVTAAEASHPGPDGTLGVDIVVAEEAKRRMGFGAEVASFEGLTLTAFWLHRNLFGGGERLRFDGEVSGIGAQSGGADYRLGVRVDRPATFTPDTSAYVEMKAEKTDQQDYNAENFLGGFGVTHIFSDRLTGDAAIRYSASTVTDAANQTRFRQLSLPLSATWDSRDAPLDATGGYYLKAEATPFLGFGTTDSGARIIGDARAYRAFGPDDRFVLAGRVQAGTILGSSIAGTPRDYLFYSGGGGTVRGQPFQSLGAQVLAGGTVRSGGLSYAALSGELRAGVTDKLGVVVFADAGYVDAGDLFGGPGDWHSGAGIGLRYDTGIGPIRFDVATPVSGTTGAGVQVYVGIGQSF